ncbi:MAG: ATP-grasp domain-containing protein [Burkholderiaceae bacterium]
MRAIAVAALSARLLAQAAVEAGLEAVALDVFGDADTRSAASQWLPIGAASALRIDAALLLDALAALARDGRVQGWVAGSGFEGRPDLLEQGAGYLPLFGTAGADVRRVRDPKTFFACLDGLRIAHPPVRHDSVAGTGSGRRWLLKDFGACGATHIRLAEGLGHATLEASQYLQEQVHGVPMSATFIADGHQAVLLGCNEQMIRPFADHPYRFHGVFGPVAVPAAVCAEVTRIVAALTEAFALRGLGSLDFMLEGEAVGVLEVNPRPPASMALYPRVGRRGDLPVLGAHLNACRDATLRGVAAPQTSVRAVRGTEIVFADRALRLNMAAAAALAETAATHDLPHCVAQDGAHETHFAAGDPLCSVSAGGADAASVKLELAQRRATVLRTLEAFQ